MIIVKTPLRISFLGGGSDIPAFYLTHGGATLSTAIDKYVYVSLNDNFDKNQLRVSYSKMEYVSHVDELEHTRVRAGLKQMGLTSGLEITSVADIPSKGTGLGSSSSFTVGLLKALHAYNSRSLSAEALAEEACRLEIETLKEPIGKQDQYIASLGGFQFIEYNTDGTTKVTTLACKPETIKELEKSILLLYTGKQRDASSILEDQVKSISEHKKADTLKRMVELAYLLKIDLEKGDLSRVGEMLHESWLLKKTLAQGISHQEIDTMYETALSHGATGGKVLGAGGGGFLLLYAKPETHKGILESLRTYRHLPVKLNAEGSTILINHKNNLYD